VWADDELAAGRAKTDARFAQGLSHLAKKCSELGLDEQARITRGWIVCRAPDRQYLFLVPESNPTEPPPGAPHLVRKWHRAFMEHRRRQADELFRLAEKQLAAHHPTSAFALVHEVLRENPNHAAARRVLGYNKVGGRWRQPGAVQRVRTPRVQHPKLGWAANKYWRIETPHFEITTDHSPEAGMQLGRRLEELFTVWQQLFVRYWTDEANLARRFDGKMPLRAVRRHYQVVLFRSRDEYVAQLSHAQPQIAMTLGYYLERQRKAFFYWGDRKAEATWFHEGTHQLFQETRLGAEGVGEDSDFWVVEAVALYMESLVRHDGYYTVGGVESPRLQYARNRALTGGFYLPLAELAGVGRDALQRDERIRHIYSQSAGLGHFLMDHDGGQYRTALVDYVQNVYRSRAKAHTLADLTGTPYEKIDAAYRRFLNVTDADLEQIPRSAKPRKLALGRTAVTDRGLAALPDLSELGWLDLSHTTVTDAGMSKLAGAVNLTDLGLEQTQITDDSLKIVGRLARLKELDLSGTRITDAGIQHLQSLRHLTTLWLTGTDITDDALTHLKGLNRLEYLNVNETRVTSKGYEEIKRSLPALDG